MHQSKVVDFFKKMEKKEFSDFGRFIRSDFFNRSQQVIALYDYLKKDYPTFDSKRIEKEKVFKKLFPKETFKARKINDLLSNLYILIEEYLIILSAKNNERHRNILLTEALEKRWLDKYFYKHLSTWENRIKQQVLTEPEEIHDLFWINQRRYRYDRTNKQDVKEDSFQQYSDYLDWYFVTEKTRIAYQVRHQEQLIKNPIQLNLHQPTLAFLKEYPSDNVFIEIYQTMKVLMEFGNEKLYFSLRTLIFEHIDKLSSEREKHEWMNFLIHYAVGQIGKGNYQYIQHNITLFKKAFPRQLLHENNYINPTHFLNAVVHASDFETEANWIEQLITDYQDDLHPKIKDNISLLANMFLKYCRKEYQEVLVDIHGVELEHYGLNLLVRSTRLRCYYELEATVGGYLIPLESACHAHVKYIKRHEVIPPNKKISNINFTRILKEMVSLHGQYQVEAKRDELIEKIKATQTISRGWLLQKAAMLK